MAHFTPQRRTPQRRGARLCDVRNKKKNINNDNVQRGTERGMWDSHSTFCAHDHYWQLLMREWEKREGERGSEERPINRGSVELRRGWQILGEGIERKERVERKTGEKKEEPGNKKKKKTKHKSLPLEV